MDYGLLIKPEVPTRAVGFPFTDVAGTGRTPGEQLPLAVRRAALFLACYSVVPGIGLNLTRCNAIPWGVKAASTIIAEQKMKVVVEAITAVP